MYFRARAHPCLVRKKNTTRALRCPLVIAAAVFIYEHLLGNVANGNFRPSACQVVAAT